MAAKRRKRHKEGGRIGYGRRSSVLSVFEANAVAVGMAIWIKANQGNQGDFLKSEIGIGSHEDTKTGRVCMGGTGGVSGLDQSECTTRQRP